MWLSWHQLLSMCHVQACSPHARQHMTSWVRLCLPQPTRMIWEGQSKMNLSRFLEG